MILEENHKSISSGSTKCPLLSIHTCVYQVRLFFGAWSEKRTKTCRIFIVLDLLPIWGGKIRYEFMRVLTKNRVAEYNKLNREAPLMKDPAAANSTT